MNNAPARRFQEVFKGSSLSPPPIWLMRQAGRYLPEYREVRAKAGSFLDLCYNPVLAAEVTLQPIRRYGFDAAILFSDILIVPDALGQGVRFVEGEGPRLDAIKDQAGLAVLRPDATQTKFARIAETVARLRQDLPKQTSLIGFCGAPWTVATYMIGGEGSSDQAAARLFAYRDPSGFQKLIDIIIDASFEYLSLQINAGADTLQIFDSWAGSLADTEFDKWVIAPNKAIVSKIRARHPSVPIIGFPRGAGTRMLEFVEKTGVSGVSCDTALPLPIMSGALADRTVVQGNLDPLLLAAGGPACDQRVRDILNAMSGKRHIFNLGHGIIPQTPPENVARLIELIRTHKP